jgi:hypothetical protein
MRTLVVGNRGRARVPRSTSYSRIDIGEARHLAVAILLVAIRGAAVSQTMGDKLDVTTESLR